MANRYSTHARWESITRWAIRAHINSVPDWPMGQTHLQFYAHDNDWPNLSQVFILIVRIAQSVLRSPNGACAYLAGAPLFDDTLGLNLPAGVAHGITSEEVVLPTESFPYLVHVLGLQDIHVCGSDATEVVDRSAREAIEMAALFYTELNDTSAFAEGAIENMSPRTMPVAPEMLSVRSSWKKNKIPQAGTEPDLAPDAPETIVAPIASTSSSSGVRDFAIPSPHGSPSTPTHRPLKISRVARTDAYRRRPHATYAGDSRTYRRRRRNAVRTTNRRS
jgi:hypothetical protein